MNPDPSEIAVLCAGRLYCDLVFTGVPRLPELGEEVFSDALSLHAGGGAFITAATFRALGWRASLFAMLPAAPFEAVVREDIAKAGVETGLCVASGEGVAPQITVAMAGGEDRAFLSHKAGRALPRLDGLKRAWRHLHIGELRTAVEHPELIPMARAAGMSVSMDCGYDDGLLKDGAGVADIVASVDVFLPNELEFGKLCLSGLPEDVCGVTVVKCGAKGARCRSAAGWMAQPTKPVKVVDATGAGDAFNGGFLASWIGGAALDVCLREGNLCGAASVQEIGGITGLSRLKARPIAAGVEIP